MLTGMTPKTQGSGKVFGHDIFQDAENVREIMGICPQHDVFFDLLTPQEHLEIFYDFKGGNPELREHEMTTLLNDTGLQGDQAKQAKNLSGGNKRKLSVAVALCGNSKFVMLDEPTAGMDLNARRAFWEMLKNYRSERIILLTTHYMDEADVLGDRIAIMADGKVICLGSSSFLKKRYGAGFKLTLAKRDKRTVSDNVGHYLNKFFDGSVEKISE